MGSFAHFFCLSIMIPVNRDAIGSIIERVVARDGLELVHWEMLGPPNKFLLRIYIDKQGGVSHADCGSVSNQVGVLLDVEDLIPHTYTLEVSSPGIERGLYKPGDYERFRGRRIRLKTINPISGQRTFHGLLVGMEGDRVHLEADSAGLMEIDYANILKANIEFEY